jgi:hypothetical protein
VSLERLTSAVEVASLVRRVESGGDFAAVLKRGDPDRGSVLLLVSSRGRHVGCLERMSNLDGGHCWQRIGPGDSSDSDAVREFLARRARIDADLWAVELDVADAERFIAETTLTG